MSTNATPSTVTVETGPKRNWCKEGFKWWCKLLRVLSVLALLFNVSCYIVLIVVGTKKEVDIPVMEKIFLVLAALGFTFLSLVFAVAELELKPFLQKVYVLHFWTARGFGIAWLGVALMKDTAVLATALSVVNANNNKDPNATQKPDESLRSFMEVFGKVIAWVEIAVGFIYVIQSAFCLRRLLDEPDLTQDLQVSLIQPEAKSGSTTTTVTVNAPPAPGGSTSTAVADAMVITNLAIALGLTSDEARRRFSGNNGRQEAEKFARERANQAANAATARAQQSAASFAAPAAASQSSLQPQSSQVAAPLPTNAAASSSQAALPDPFADDDVGGRRKKMDDDDELERQYYATHTKQ